MTTLRVWNRTRDIVLCGKCKVANNIFTRVRGLLGRSTLAEDEGLLIAPCPSIHMFGMKFAIDVLFLTKENVVTDLVENIAPGKFYVANPNHGRAHAALELAAGSISRSGTQCGDRLHIEDVN